MLLSDIPAWVTDPPYLLPEIIDQSQTRFEPTLREFWQVEFIQQPPSLLTKQVAHRGGHPVLGEDRAS